MAVAMLDPSEGDLILDPACGTAGFLITAMNHVIEKIRTAESKRWGDIERAETAVRERVQRFAQKYIVGIDLNPNLVKASKMNMVMNNDGTGGLFQANALRHPSRGRTICVRESSWDEWIFSSRIRRSGPRSPLMNLQFSKTTISVTSGSMTRTLTPGP